MTAIDKGTDREGVRVDVPKGDIVLSYLEHEIDPHVSVPLYIQWGTFQQLPTLHKEEPGSLSDSPKDEMSLESTKRKRKRMMNKHKHRKNLKKMKFTLRKVGRK